MKGFLLLNGTKVSKKVFQYWWKEGDLVVAADGGGEWAKVNGVLPDYLMGDFDTISQNSLIYFQKKKVKIKTYSSNKKHTDGFLALSWLKRQNPIEIYVLGSVVPRLDLFWSFLAVFSRSDFPIYYLTESFTTTLLSGRYSIYAEEPALFSLLPKQTTLLTLEQVYYPLNNKRLTKGNDLTVSNRMLGRKMMLTSTRPIWFVGFNSNFYFQKI